MPQDEKRQRLRSEGANQIEHLDHEIKMDQSEGRMPSDWSILT